LRRSVEDKWCSTDNVGSVQLPIEYTTGGLSLAARLRADGMSWNVVRPTDENQVLTAVFDGYLSAEEGAASASAFRAAFGDTSLAVVWDVTRMTGFDGGARGAWAKAIWPIRNQIKSLKVIGAKGNIRVAAIFLAFLLGKPYEVVASGAPEV
jgi:hypothetical protein